MIYRIVHPNDDPDANSVEDAFITADSISTAEHGNVRFWSEDTCVGVLIAPRPGTVIVAAECVGCDDDEADDYDFTDIDEMQAEVDELTALGNAALSSARAAQDIIDRRREARG